MEPTEGEIVYGEHWTGEGGTTKELLIERRRNIVVNAAPDDEGYMMAGNGQTLKQARSHAIAKNAKYRRFPLFVDESAATVPTRGVPASAVGPVR